MRGERWRGRPGRHEEGEQSERQMGREKDRGAERTCQKQVLIAARKIGTYMMRGDIFDSSAPTRDVSDN